MWLWSAKPEACAMEASGSEEFNTLANANSNLAPRTHSPGETPNRSRNARAK
jgi:hypothetical protein